MTYVFSSSADLCWYAAHRSVVIIQKFKNNEKRKKIYVINPLFIRHSKIAKFDSHIDQAYTKSWHQIERNCASNQ